MAELSAPRRCFISVTRGRTQRGRGPGDWLPFPQVFTVNEEQQT